MHADNPEEKNTRKKASCLFSELPVSLLVAQHVQCSSLFSSHLFTCVMLHLLLFMRSFVRRHRSKSEKQTVCVVLSYSLSLSLCVCVFLVFLFVVRLRQRKIKALENKNIIMHEEVS